VAINSERWFPIRRGLDGLKRAGSETGAPGHCAADNHFLQNFSTKNAGWQDFGLSFAIFDR